MVWSIPYRMCFETAPAGQNRRAMRHGKVRPEAGVCIGLPRWMLCDCVVRSVLGRCSVRVSGACVAGKRLNFTCMPVRDLGMGLAAHFNASSASNKKSGNAIVPDHSLEK